MIASEATDPLAWDDFLLSQRYSPFLQSWAMGEVYRKIGQEPVRIEVRSSEKIKAICFAHVVPARRGRHLSVPYGPILADADALSPLMDELRREATVHDCAFIRFSPFWPTQEPNTLLLQGARSSPLHLLAEHIWYLPLTERDVWTDPDLAPGKPKTEEALLADMRSTARNLIRRAGKDGVTISLSEDPLADLHHFITLHDETRLRHGFTPYTNAFFRAQVETFAASKQALLYLAWYQGQVIASSIHMSFGGETSYHHGASTAAFRKIPSSYLLQWTAICDALKRGDSIYNFWGVAPVQKDEKEWRVTDDKHPFAGVTLFKTGFGGNHLPLHHCADVPLKMSYQLTRSFELYRKWKRGF